jgi:glycerol-1-phosphate dehydrogenase [NAD(P)+]
MDDFSAEIERYRKLLRIRHGLIAPEVCCLQSDQTKHKLIQLLSGYKRVLYVADTDSFKAAEKVISVLPLENTECIYQVFSAPAKPTMVNALHVIEVTKNTKAEAIFAIGSGSIVDICKLAAHELVNQLIIFPTAPSMNGYTSINASITHEGLKQSFHTFLAKAVVADMDVLKNAPTRMTLAGVVDALVYKSAMLDWKLSHLLLETPYEEVLESLAFSSPDSTMHTLLLQGLAMTYAGTSSPASGSEHMLAHIVEMMHPALCADILHGELIAHTLPLCVAHQTMLLDSASPPILKPAGNATELSHIFGDAWQTIQPIFELKQNALNTARDSLNERLQQNWKYWRDVLRPFLLNEASLEPLQEITSAPGITKACSEWLPYAHFTRNRFTCLDLKCE